MAAVLTKHRFGEVSYRFRIEIPKIPISSFAHGVVPAQFVQFQDETSFVLFRHGNGSPIFGFGAWCALRKANVANASVNRPAEGLINPLPHISTFNSGTDPGKDVCMQKTVAEVQLPEILRNKSSHLVKLPGKIDSFSLLLRATPEGELKRSIEDQFHTMVFATRKEIRKFCLAIALCQAKVYWTSIRTAPPANLSRVMLAPPHHPSRASSVRRAASL
jgi:hypothetical protein